jgi:hypothetical protein
MFWCLAVTCSDLPDHGQAISRGSLQQVRGGGPAALLTAEGEAQERLALPPISPGRTSVDTYRTARRFSLCSAIPPVGRVILAAFVVSVARGDGSEADDLVARSPGS